MGMYTHSSGSSMGMDPQGSGYQFSDAQVLTQVLVYELVDHLASAFKQA